MNYLKYILLIFLGFSNLTFATTFTEGKTMSLMSLRYGAFVYANGSSIDSEWWLEELYDLTDTSKSRAKFKILYTDQGYIRLRNTYSQNCIGLYQGFSGLYVTQRSCSSSDTDLDLLPLENGSVVVKFVAENVCLWGSPAQGEYGMTVSSCPQSFQPVELEQQWVLTPTVLTKGERLD